MIKNNLTILLAKKNMDKRDLVKITDLDNHTVNNLFLGKTTKISFSTLDKLCYALECDTNDILKYVPDKFLF